MPLAQEVADTLEETGRVVVDASEDDHVNRQWVRIDGATATDLAMVLLHNQAVVTTFRKHQLPGEDITGYQVWFGRLRTLREPKLVERDHLYD